MRGAVSRKCRPAKAWRGGIFGTQRLARHLWRTCFALFIATASIFLARPQLFPALLTKTHVLFLLGILPLLLMVFWLVRASFTKAFKAPNQVIRERKTRVQVAQSTRTSTLALPPYVSEHSSEGATRDEMRFKIYAPFSKGMNGGDDGARTRDLCRDRAAF